MFGQSKALNRIAESITAEDICTPFAFRFAHITETKEAETQWDEFCMDENCDPFDHMALVTKEGKPEGILAYDELSPPQEIVDDTMDKLDLSNLISAETPLLDIARYYMADSARVFTVLKGNRPVGWFSYYGLLGPPFRACLFGLILAVELSMADLLKRDAKAAVGKLPEKRVEAAKRVYGLRNEKRQYEHEPGGNALIDCSTFIDKVIILEKLPRVLSKLPAFNRSLLVKAEQIRNSLAHPTPDYELAHLLPQHELQGFVSGLSNFEQELASFLKSDGEIS